MIIPKILTQSLALFITVYVFVFWLVHKKTGSDNEIIFLFAFLVSMISEILDIAAQVVSSDFLIVFSDLIAESVMKTYLVTIPLSIFVIMLYANFSVLDPKQYRLFRIIILLSSLVNSVVIWFLPIKINIHDNCNTPEGSSVFFTYAISAVVALTILIELIIFRKKLNRATFVANTVWLALFLCGGIIQYLTINTFGIPIISFLIAVGDLAIYLVLENPGNKYDYIKNCFHYETFVKYITEAIRFDELQSILFLNVSTNNNEDIRYIGSVFSSIVAANLENDDIKIFKGIANELIITSKEFILLQDIASTVYSHVHKVEEDNNIEINASVVLIPSIGKIKSYGLLREILDDYRIKGNLNNENIQYFTINDKTIEKYNKNSEIALDIDYAIKNKLVDIRFQSLNSLKGDDKQVYEIITTLTNANNTILFPGEYSRIANKNDKFIQIDEYSFERVCSVLEKALSQRNKLGYVLVRASVQAIENDGFIDRVVELMRQHDVPYKYVCFEITNADAILKKDILLKNITYMQKLGMTFAMGGFGSGESNLNYFIDLPMDIVKYDQSILKNAIVDPNAAMIMKDVTELAHSLGYKVIAVGAKNEEEVKLINDYDIDMVIGDQLSEVLSENEFINALSMGGAE